jgi:DNA-binding NarL/FixJ family response regulator
MDHARLMIVEDEVIIAEDLQRNLHACGYDVLGYAVDGQEAVDMALRVRPDLILMDVFLDERSIDGIAAAQAIVESIDTAIIYVSGHSDEDLIDNAVRSGADGYIVKPYQLSQVTSAIKLALHRRREAHRSRHSKGHGTQSVGEEPVAAIKGRPQAALGDDRSDRGTSDRVLEPFRVTPREREIIHGLLRGRRVSAVADVLGISVHTARNHLRSIFRKLDLHSQDELVRFLIDGERV